MRSHWMTKLVAGSAIAVLALGGVACEIDEDAIDPGLENDLLDEDF